MCKKTSILSEIAIKHHPRFVRSQDLRNAAISDPDLFNVERIVEESMAAVGGYDFIDSSHCDFNDQDVSDSKTASIRLTSSKSKNSFTGIIDGVVNPHGAAKAGALRCVVYNPHTDGLRYYFLPKGVWDRLVYLHTKTGQGRISFTYNLERDSIDKLDQYRCESFEELATMSTARLRSRLESDIEAKMQTLAQLCEHSDPASVTDLIQRIKIPTTIDHNEQILEEIDA
jgi:hypothetical protein